MGAVYRAHDPRIGRDVELLILRSIHTLDFPVLEGTLARYPYSQPSQR